MVPSPGPHCGSQLPQLEHLINTSQLISCGRTFRTLKDRKREMVEILDFPLGQESTKLSPVELRQGPGALGINSSARRSDLGISGVGTWVAGALRALWVVMQAQ